MTRTQGQEKILFLPFNHLQFLLTHICRYFDSEFTGESVELTPPDHKGGPLDQIQEGEEEAEDEYFTQFSYQGASVLGGTSLLSVNSH